MNTPSVSTGFTPVEPRLTGYSVIAARRHREHKLSTIGSKITLCMTSTNVREVLQMGSGLNSLRLGLPVSN